MIQTNKGFIVKGTMSIPKETQERCTWDEMPKPKMEYQKIRMKDNGLKMGKAHKKLVVLKITVGGKGLNVK